MKIRFQIWTLTTLTVMYLTTAMGQDIAQVQRIKERFTSINLDSTYTLVTLDNEEFLEPMTDGGGQLKGYSKNGRISKIYEWIGLSYCVQAREYYFWERELIFVYEKEDDFVVDSLGTSDHTKIKTVFEGRYYFENDKLIKSETIGEKKVNDRLLFDSQNKEAQLLSLSQDRITLLTEKRK